MTVLVPTNFASPLTGNEILTAFGVSSNGQPSSQNFKLTTAQIAALANTDGGVGLTVGGVATGTFSLASSTTLTNVVGLAATVVAGGVYQVDIYLATTNNGTGGIKLALTGSTATATSVLLDTQVYNTTTLTAETNSNTLAGPLVSAAVAATLVFITGTITVNAAGTIQLQAAQNTSNATALTVTNGSYISLTRLA